MARIETDVVVVGTGPGGATVARQLAGQGRDVVLVERGTWNQWAVGRYASLLTINKLVRPRGGGLMARGITVGGSSVVYNGNAYDPPSWLKTELGIDLSEETRQTKEELMIAPLPESFYRKWPCTLRLVEAAADVGIQLVPQQKFIDPGKCHPSCDDCMLGCRRGAKWTARSYVQEGEQNGARLFTGAFVDRVIIENGAARGIFVKSPHVDEIRANKIVISAGGIGTPAILLRSGIKKAGEGFFIDPMNVVYAIGRELGPKNEMTFCFASEQFVETEGFLVGTIGALPVFGNKMLRLAKSMGTAAVTGRLPRVMGMFTKIGDSPGGTISIREKITKPYLPEDRERFVRGTEACKKIMLKAGADPDTFMVDHNVGGHPGGTAAIGRVVDDHLEAFAAKNLFVCDASVFPRSPGRPPTLTLIALARHLAKTL
ncbi:MAG: GMC family oxidoreductase [Thermodesulfobacteriota bacterium]